MVGSRIVFNKKSDDFFISGCAVFDIAKAIKIVAVIKKACTDIVDEEFQMQERELELLSFNEKEREERLCQGKEMVK